MKLTPTKIDKNIFYQKISDFLEEFEGYEKELYKDSGGIPHIGYGFNLEDPNLCLAVIEVIFPKKSKKMINPYGVKNNKKN